MNWVKYDDKKVVVHNLLYVQKWLLIEGQKSKIHESFLGSNKEIWEFCVCLKE
jgi:hypothetical protein